MMAPVLPWLPDRHLGVVATLAHADELVAQIGNLLFAYLSQTDDVIRIREVSHESVSNAVVDRISPIPRKMPLLVADALVTLRAAVEHTLYTEAEFLNGGTLDEKAARSIEMPATLTHPDYMDWIAKRARRTPSSMATGSELLRRVEGLQPFHRNIRPDLHPLARLVLHTNHAKHRTPAITAVRLVTIVRDDDVPRALKDIDLRPEGPLRVGDVIAQTPLGERIPAALFPTIGINRPGTDSWPILMHELDEISRWVREQAIPRLVTGGSPPAQVIPPRYEIGVGHDDERQAIALGSSLTAAERNKLQLGAASARQSMVALLLPISNALPPEGLAAWLAQLSDADVLMRVDRLKSSLTYEASLTEQNLQVLESLCEEAIAFLEGQPAS